MRVKFPKNHVVEYVFGYGYGLFIEGQDYLPAFEIFRNRYGRFGACVPDDEAGHLERVGFRGREFDCAAGEPAYSQGVLPGDHSVIPVSSFGSRSS